MYSLTLPDIVWLFHFVAGDGITEKKIRNLIKSLIRLVNHCKEITS